VGVGAGAVCDGARPEPCSSSYTDAAVGSAKERLSGLGGRQVIDPMDGSYDADATQIAFYGEASPSLGRNVGSAAGYPGLLSR